MKFSKKYSQNPNPFYQNSHSNNFIPILQPKDALNERENKFFYLLIIFSIIITLVKKMLITGQILAHLKKLVSH